MKSSRLLIYLVCITATIALFVRYEPGTSHASPQSCDTVVVAEADIARQAENTFPTNNWVLYTRNAGDGLFRVGPAIPPLGIGSFETSTPAGADKVFLFNYDHVNTSLTDINRISYATYRTPSESDNDVQLPSINIQVDINGGTFNPVDLTTLVFEPVYNPSQGPIQDGTWQTWDAYLNGQAIWWSSTTIPGVCARDCFVSWNTILLNNPDATVLGFGINQGSGNGALTASSDALSLGYGTECVIYDFEPYKVATTKESCKNGGWKTVFRADGTSFKNQGDCIQYFNTGQ